MGQLGAIVWMVLLLNCVVESPCPDGTHWFVCWGKKQVHANVVISILRLESLAWVLDVSSPALCLAKKDAADETCFCFRIFEQLIL